MNYIDFIIGTLNKSNTNIICPFKYAEYCLKIKSYKTCSVCHVAQKEYTSMFGDNSNVKNI